jgi:hypothetical protein
MSSSLLRSWLVVVFCKARSVSDQLLLRLVKTIYTQRQSWTKDKAFEHRKRNRWTAKCWMSGKVIGMHAQFLFWETEKQAPILHHCVPHLSNGRQFQRFPSVLSHCTVCRRNRNRKHFQSPAKKPRFSTKPTKRQSWSNWKYILSRRHGSYSKLSSSWEFIFPTVSQNAIADLPLPSASDGIHKTNQSTHVSYTAAHFWSLHQDLF